MVCDQMAALVEKRLDDANHLQVRGAPLLLNRPFVMVFFVSLCAAPSPPLPSLLLCTRYPCIAVFLFEDHLFLYTSSSHTHSTLERLSLRGAGRA